MSDDPSPQFMTARCLSGRSGPSAVQAECQPVGGAPSRGGGWSPGRRVTGACPALTSTRRVSATCSVQNPPLSGRRAPLMWTSRRDSQGGNTRSHLPSEVDNNNNINNKSM